MSEAAIEPELVPFEEAARRLGVRAEDVDFLLACGVLERRRGGLGARSLELFVDQVRAALRPNDPLSSGVEHSILALRSEWDRALVERGPARPRKIFGAVELGRHPDGTMVFAVEDALDRIVARNLHILGGGRVRHLIVERALMERWGALGEVLEHVPPEVIARVPAAVARAFRIVPIELASGPGAGAATRLIVASAEPLAASALVSIAAAVGLEVDYVVVSEAALAAALERYYGEGGEVLAGKLGKKKRSAPRPSQPSTFTTPVAIDFAGPAASARISVPTPAPLPRPLPPVPPPVLAPPAVRSAHMGAVTIAPAQAASVLAPQARETPTRGPMMARPPAMAARPPTGRIAPAPAAAPPPPPPLDFRSEDKAIEVSKVASALRDLADDRSDAARRPVSKSEPAPEPMHRTKDAFDAGESSGAAVAALSISAANLAPVETESRAQLREVGSDESMETEAFELMERQAPSGEELILDDSSEGAAFDALDTGATLSRKRAVAPMPVAASPSRAGGVGGVARAMVELGGVVGSLSGARSSPATKPSHSNAPAGMPQPAPPGDFKEAERKADDEPETFERKATVRYYSQMYARRNYPLLVVVSKRSIQKIVKQFVAQVESKKSFKIRRGNPFVTVRPIIPGCLCVPAEITLDVKPKVAEAKFWVTPTAEGVLEDARVEVLYEGKVVSTIETPTRVTTQTIAKVSGSAAFLSTSAGPFFDAFGLSVKKAGASFLADILADVSGGHLRFGVAGIFAFLALVFFIKRRPKAGPETEGFFDWGVEDEVEGDPLVRAVKAKLVVVGPEGRDVVDLVHASTLVGSAATAHVRVKGARSLPDVACELRYDDTFLLRARSGGIKVNGEELREGEERKLGRDAVVELDSGRVTLWLLDVRQDPALDGRRDEILEKLVQARPSFEKELRWIWKRTADEPVRAALLEAMKDAFADPQGWQRARASLKL